MATQRRKPQQVSKTVQQNRRRVSEEAPPEDDAMYLGDDLSEYDIPEEEVRHQTSQNYQSRYTSERKQQSKPRVNKTNGHRVLPWNNIELEGTVFGDPELRVNRDGEPWLTTFSLAVYNGKFPNGEYRPSIWIQIKVYGKKSEDADAEISDRCRIRVLGMLDQFRTEDGKYLFSVRCDFFEVTRR